MQIGVSDSGTPGSRTPGPHLEGYHGFDPFLGGLAKMAQYPNIKRSKRGEYGTVDGQGGQDPSRRGPKMTQNSPFWVILGTPYFGVLYN